MAAPYTTRAWCTASGVSAVVEALQEIEQGRAVAWRQGGKTVGQDLVRDPMPRVEHLLASRCQMVLDASPMTWPAFDQALSHQPAGECAERLLALECRRGQGARRRPR